MAGHPEDHDLSLECVSSVEAFPKKPLVKDDPDLEVPFPQLCGESVEFLGHASDAVIVLSNYRLLIRYPHSFINVPVRLIESVECKELFYIVIQCKDGKSLRCKFSTNEQCQDWLIRLTAATAAPEKLEDVFAFAFHAWCFDQLHREPELPMPGTCFLQTPGGLFEYDFDVERRRLGFDMDHAWRVFENTDFKFCSTYPKMHIVPAWAMDDVIRKVANFRTSHRFPSVVWRHQLNGAVIARCSQPEVGWLGWRSTEDEYMMEAILKSCIADDPRTKHWEGEEQLANGSAGGESRADLSLLPTLGSNDAAGRKLLIIDARSYTAAWANRAKGGGCECPEYYSACDIQFMGLANIHVVRKSFQSVRSLCSSSPEMANWLTSLENTKWLHNLSLLLKSTVIVVNAIEDGNPVVVHCTDGWDRTPQLVALAELMLDPYYRTLEGFQVLVEREWLDFGHKFGERCGHQPGHDDMNERCPAFVQWLDAVHQLMRQYPTDFEFNETFLVKLVQHTYSCLFGTFLCNSAFERHKHILKERTCSVWSLLVVEGHKYRNFLYNPSNEQVLNPATNIRDLSIWTSVYMSDTAPASPDESVPPSQKRVPSQTENTKLPRTRSVDDIHTASTEGEDGRRGSIVDNASLPLRRLSDPNLSDLRLEGRMATPPPNRKLSERSPESPSMGCRDGSEVRSEQRNEAEQVSELELSEVKPAMNGHSDMDSEPEMENGEGNINGSIAPLSNGHDDLLNGNCVVDDDEEEFNAETSNSSKNSMTSTPIKACRTNSANSIDSGRLEGSTDTLTEDTTQQPGDSGVAIETTQHNGHFCNGDAACDTSDIDTPKGSRTNSRNGSCGDVDQDVMPSSNRLSPNGRKLEQCTSISTSTSDISSSHVSMTSEALCLESMRASMFWSATNHDTGSRTRPPMPLHTKLANDPRSRNLSGGSSIPSFSSSSAHSSSRPSPSIDGVANLKFIATPSHTPPQTTLPTSPSTLRLGRHLDEDGLTCVNMPQQTQLLDVMQQHEQEILALHQKVQQLHSYLKQMQDQHSMGLVPVINGEVNGEMLNQKDLDAELAEAGHHSRCNSLHSDLSWEQLNEEDAKRTLWVPDHAVTQCPMCNIQFGLLYRRHHCRSCGQIFCGRCSNYFTSIPKEQLYKPERVCKTCYDQLLSALDKEAHDNGCKRKSEMVLVADQG